MFVGRLCISSFLSDASAFQDRIIVNTCIESSSDLTVALYFLGMYK